MSPLLNIHLRARLFLQGLVVLLFFILILSCSRFETSPEIQPYENLLTIVADFDSHMLDDFYRFPYPRDITGQNLYKATIVRLSNYRTLDKGRFQDVVDYKLGQAYEKIGDYAIAVDMYTKVIHSGSILAEEAGKRLSVVKEFYAVSQMTPDSQSLREYVALLQRRIAQFGILAEKCRQTEYEPIARLEQERAEIEYALFLNANKYVIEYGIAKTTEQFDSLTKKFHDSKNIYEHYLRVGDFYFEMAKEYSFQNAPQRSRFDIDEFEKYINSARDYYFIVDQADGTHEKPEARAKLAALASFADKVRKQAM